MKGALGSLYYVTVSVCGTPVEAIDPGSSASMSFELLQKVG